jgi:hypothetical protein
MRNLQNHTTLMRKHDSPYKIIKYNGDKETFLLIRKHILYDTKGMINNCG